MRITRALVDNTLLKSLSKSNDLRAKYFKEISTGKRINIASDDPLGSARLINLNKTLLQMERYQKNIDDSKTWVQLTEGALDSMNEIMQRAISEAMSGSNDTLGEDARENMAAQIQEFLSSMVEQANTKNGSRYLFGGTVIDSPPFTITNKVENESFTSSLDKAVQLGQTDISTDAITVTSSDGSVTFTEGTDYEIDRKRGTITVLSSGSMSDSTDYSISYKTNDASVVSVNDKGTDGKIVREIAKDQLLQVNISGSQAFTSEINVFQSLVDLKNALMRNDGNEIRNTTEKLRQSDDQIVRYLGKAGLKYNHLTDTEQALTSYSLQIKSMKSSIEDADFAEASVNLEIQDNAYNAALKAGAKILQLNLLDFLG
ncbi:MAG: flagellar hook-associated protein 3 [Actinobacteria bacterium]|nr:flagellar hook-associated protein 3 [Actinomycetota bacterium]